MKITNETVAAAYEILQKYKAGKADLETQIIENEQWWKLRHTDSTDTKASGWLFNCIINKHADAMDNLPTCAVLPREEADRGSAAVLDKVLPALLERCKFESVYSDCWYDKLKSGTACYGVFWNPSLDSGLGNVDIHRIDLLNLFWEPGISSLQMSENIFHVELYNNDYLRVKYPQLEEYLTSPVFETSRYIYNDSVDTSEKTSVIDWYYKKKVGSKTVLHYAKFALGQLLYASENDPKYAERGYYDHGKYPFILDTFYPIKGSPCGFGIIDAMKSTQSSIDALDTSIVKNARMASERRFFIRGDGAINEREFADWKNPFVHYNGSGDPSSSIMPIEMPYLSSTYTTILANKIDELKETSGNRDFSQGITSGGVTAASAIAALQEAGSKTTRDMLSASYRAFEEICTVMIEIIRQFYTVPRCFRISGKENELEFSLFSSDVIEAPVYDIKVCAHKKSPFSRAGLNELAIQLYNMGMFSPERKREAELCISMMDFEGKDSILHRICEVEV